MFVRSPSLGRCIDARGQPVHPAERASVTQARAAYPRRRSSNANNLCGQNSAGFPQICRPFKGIICDDISEFESYMPSHAVRSPCARL